jgi:glycosyltransferase involved in cell wall biosynthesis
VTKSRLSNERLSLAIANWGFDRELDDPDALLARYHALVGWADALANAGADTVTVVQRFVRNVTLRRKGIEYRFLNDGPRLPDSWLWGTRMARAIHTIRPDAVHVNGCIFPLFVRNLRRRLSPRTAIVVQDHGGSGIQNQSHGLRNWPWRTWHRFGLRAADAFLFTARELAVPWSRQGIIGCEQDVFEIPEASTDLGPLRIPVDGRRPLPGRPALLWVGRLDSNKDPLTILAGFERAAGLLPDAALTFVFGDDELLPAMRSRIAASPVLAPRVHLRGRMDRSELAALYEGADLFVLGSHREVASFALIEALSFGLTPIVSEIPAFRALTGGGRVGALFPPGDVEALSRAIERLGREDFVSRRELVRSHFARELSWSAIGLKALQIYRAAAAKRQELLHQLK